jgi:hypothetical protein
LNSPRCWSPLLQVLRISKMLVPSVTGVELLLVPRPKFLVDNHSKWLRLLLEGLELH